MCRGKLCAIDVESVVYQSLVSSMIYLSYDSELSIVQPCSWQRATRRVNFEAVLWKFLRLERQMAHGTMCNCHLWA